jgi:hypothetical protein
MRNNQAPPLQSHISSFPASLVKAPDSMGDTTHPFSTTVVLTSLFLFRVPFAFASTGPSSPVYVPGPEGRGTIGLLTTCLITLSLCVWTAIHMNVPPGEIRRSKWRKFVHKLGWTVLAVFAPEVVVWRAFAQFTEALKLGVAINEWLLEYKKKRRHEQGDANERLENTDAAITSSDTKQDVESGNRAKSRTNWFWTKKLLLCDTNENEGEWSLSMAFFAVMGGFEVKTDEKHSWLFRNAPEVPLYKLQGWFDQWELASTEHQETTLTSQGVLCMVKIAFCSQKEVSKLRLLPFDAARLESIVRDKTKADSLAKGLVCIQGIWMLIQTIARRAAGLPITLIELNTMAHVGCALMLYLTWWYKPQDIQESEVVEVDGQLAAYLSSGVLQGCLRVERNETPRKPDTTINTNDLGNGLSGDHNSESSLPAQDESAHKVEQSTQRVDDENRIQIPTQISMRSGQRFKEFPFIASRHWRYFGEMMRRLRLLTDFWENQDHLEWIKDGFITFDGKRPVKYLCYKASNLSIIGKLGDDDDNNNDNDNSNDEDDDRDEEYSAITKSITNSLPLLALLSLFYGGIHASSWNSHFPSFIEQTLWQVAACTVASGGFVMLLWLSAVRVFVSAPYEAIVRAVFEHWIISTIYIKTAKTWGDFAVLIWMLVAKVWIVLWGLARMYLITEAFISIRSLPVGAYNTTNWVDVLPHIG